MKITIEQYKKISEKPHVKCGVYESNKWIPGLSVVDKNSATVYLCYDLAEEAEDPYYRLIVELQDKNKLVK